MQRDRRISLVGLAWFFLAASHVVAGYGQEPAEQNDLRLGPMMRLESQPEGSFAFSCLVEVNRPSHAQLTVKLVDVAGGKASPVVTHAFTWRGENAGDAIQGQVLLFGQAGEALGRRGQHYLSLLAGFDGNPVHRGQSAGPLAVPEASRWWSRYGSEMVVGDAGRQESLAYVMGSGEAIPFKSLAELQALSQRSPQRFLAVVLEFAPTNP